MQRGRGQVARSRSLTRRGRRAENDRPEGLPPTPSGAITLGLRNFTNEFKALAEYLRGERNEELKGQEEETVRCGRRTLPLTACG